MSKPFRVCCFFRCTREVIGSTCCHWFHQLCFIILLCLLGTTTLPIRNGGIATISFILCVTILFTFLVKQFWNYGMNYTVNKSVVIQRLANLMICNHRVTLFQRYKTYEDYVNTIWRCNNTPQCSSYSHYLCCNYNAKKNHTPLMSHMLSEPCTAI